MNKKIKIIDLLNMISKGEEVPNKIKYSETTFHFDEYMKMYESDLMNDGDLLSYINGSDLNDEIEIIIEPKKIEKILNKTNATLTCIKDSETINGGEYYVIHSDFIIALEEEINEIIDYINKGE